MIDYKALVGDASDNIPGVPGVGPKTASAILKKYKTLDNFFKKGAKEKIFEKIKRNKDLAILSRELAAINLSVPVKVKLEELILSPIPKKIERYFEENDFSSLLKRVGAVEKSDINSEIATFKKLIQNKIPFQGIGQEVITIEDDAQLLEKDRLSSKTKIGYDLKDFFKKTFLAPPVFDVKIGLELLEIKTRDWLEACQKILKEKISQKEFLLKSYSWLTKKIKTAGLEKIFYGIEMLLVPVLATMEKNGVLIDREELRSVQTKLTSEIKGVKKEIIKKMGESINLNSPKQLLVYFQKKGLKIKSTSAEKLEKISQDYPLVKEILEYREFFKLKTTYLDPLEKLVGNDSRIHPTFLQLGAATGRLSCQNPNLQNIPQESSWSIQIRNIFVAPKSFFLVSFDYSQIELRILAHLTQDQNMLAAFKRGEDIHSLTAQKIFGVKKEEVAPHMRRLAKTLNFGMIYGMGYRALSQTAKIPPDQAKDFIKKYFEQFPSIRNWQAKVLESSRQSGISSNVNGRFRSVFSINSPNQFLASSAEREAVNMPTQSLAADVLKLAMIKVFDYVVQNGLSEKIKLILSIHDELIFEISQDLLKNGTDSPTAQKIKELMELSYKLDAPLKVDIKTGKKWGELE